MKAHDFEFNNKRLSEFGFVLCNFGGSKGLETVSDSAEISFTTVLTMNGTKHNLTSVSYENCLESTVQICKHSCNGDIQEITAVEHRRLTSWLCRKQFLKFKILDEDNIDLYHEAKIDVSRIEIDGKLYGFELTISTNRPFALKEPRVITINNTVRYGAHSINDTSDEEGYIYPYTEITVKNGGTLDIYNAIEQRHTIIQNCRADEVITMDYPVIQSSVSSHDIQNDFNWDFFRIANTYDNSRNDLIISLPCSIKIKYSPIVKVGL